MESMNDLQADKNIFQATNCIQFKLKRTKKPKAPDFQSTKIRAHVVLNLIHIYFTLCMHVQKNNW